MNDEHMTQFKRYQKDSKAIFDALFPDFPNQGFADGVAVANAFQKMDKNYWSLTTPINSSFNLLKAMHSALHTPESKEVCCDLFFEFLDKNPEQILMTFNAENNKSKKGLMLYGAIDFLIWTGNASKIKEYATLLKNELFSPTLSEDTVADMLQYFTPKKSRFSFGLLDFYEAVGLKIPEYNFNDMLSYINNVEQHTDKQTIDRFAKLAPFNKEFFFKRFIPHYQEYVDSNETTTSTASYEAILQANSDLLLHRRRDKDGKPLIAKLLFDKEACGVWPGNTRRKRWIPLVDIICKAFPSIEPNELLPSANPGKSDSSISLYEKHHLKYIFVGCRRLGFDSDDTLFTQVIDKYDCPFFNVVADSIMWDNTKFFMKDVETMERLYPGSISDGVKKFNLFMEDKTIRKPPILQDLHIINNFVLSHTIKSDIMPDIQNTNTTNIKNKI